MYLCSYLAPPKELQDSGGGERGGMGARAGNAPNRNQCKMSADAPAAPQLDA